MAAGSKRHQRSSIGENARTFDRPCQREKHLKQALDRKISCRLRQKPCYNIVRVNEFDRVPDRPQRRHKICIPNERSRLENSFMISVWV